MDVPRDTEATVRTRVRTDLEGAGIKTRGFRAVSYPYGVCGVARVWFILCTGRDRLEIIFSGGRGRDPKPGDGERTSDRGVACCDKPLGLIREDDGIRGDVTYVRDGREILRRYDLDGTHFHTLGHAVSSNSDDV